MGVVDSFSVERRAILHFLGRVHWNKWRDIGVNPRIPSLIVEQVGIRVDYGISSASVDPRLFEAQAIGAVVVGVNQKTAPWALRKAYGRPIGPRNSVRSYCAILKNAHKPIQCRSAFWIAVLRVGGYRIFREMR